MEKYYAGIGARQTPIWATNIMNALAIKLEQDGFILRSGGAEGADSAFERGAKTKQIFRPEHATPDSIIHAEQFHPNWDGLNDYVKRLHARNSQIILGEDLNSPVKFAICWTKDGRIVGGTGQAIKVCKHHGIPVFNIAVPETLERFKNYLGIEPTESLL